MKDFEYNKQIHKTVIKSGLISIYFTNVLLGIEYYGRLCK